MLPTVAACQLAVDDSAGASNLERIRGRVDALPDRVDLAVFPEYAMTGFVDDERVRDAAIERDGREIEELRSLASEETIDLVVGFLEADDDDLFNAVGYLPAQGTATVYRKRHPWDREKELVTSGDERVIVETPAGRAGILTCYDLNFVDESAHFTGERVDLLLVPGAWPAAYVDNWRLLLRARALDGVRWVVGAGRTGTASGTDETEYAGRSLVARPDGGIHAELDRREDDLIVDLDSAVLDRQRDLVGIF